jgi:hypothetical protein
MKKQANFEKDANPEKFAVNMKCLKIFKAFTKSTEGLLKAKEVW